ncbi:MAG: N-acetyltransferase family protein [Clostridiaceae bacterium]
MNIEIRKFKLDDVKSMIKIWNEIVEDGIAFPQKELLDINTGLEFFNQQVFTGVAENKENNEILGLYILHPNNIGRCGHICNASYAVNSVIRGNHIGEKLVLHSMKQGKKLGFEILQFNAVVKSNEGALHLYEKLGFVKLGIIPKGFLMKDGTYEDIIPHYHVL